MSNFFVKQKYQDDPYSIVTSSMSPAKSSIQEQSTKLCIIIDANTPIIMRTHLPADGITLGQFKYIASLEHDNFKFYFKSKDSEFGIVKEEIIDDNCTLPYDGEKIVAWVISDKNNQSSLFEVNRKQQQQTLSSINDNNNLINQSNQSVNSSECSASNFYNHNSIIIRVDLNLDNYNFLGLTLVGKSDESNDFDKGIYVAAIAKNSIVEQDGRIDIGDKILSINNLELINMKNDDAIATFKIFVERRGPISLVLERNLTKLTKTFNYMETNKNFETVTNMLKKELYPQNDVLIQQQQHSPRLKFNQPQPPPLPPANINYEHLPVPLFGDNFNKSLRKQSKSRLQDNEKQLKNKVLCSGTNSLPRSITPKSLYAQTNFETMFNGSTNNNNDHNSSSNNDCQIYMRHDSRSVYESNTPTSIRQLNNIILHCKRDTIQTIYSTLKEDSKSLDIKDREWLRVIIKQSFLGSDLVKWLSRNVFGFNHKREIKQYANQMLTMGLIKNPMSSSTFSEKCFYTLS